MNIGNLLQKLQSLRSKEEARNFLIEALEQNSNAWSNIKYVTGYLGNEERTRILELFK